MSVKLPKRITDKNGKQNTVYVSAMPKLGASKRITSLLKNRGSRVMTAKEAASITDVIKSSKIGFLLSDPEREEFVNNIQFSKSFTPVPGTNYSEMKIKNYDESIELTFVNHHLMGIWNVAIKREPTSSYSFTSADTLRNNLKRTAESIRISHSRA